MDKRRLSRRISDLEEPSDVSDLPLASLALLLSADDVESTSQENVILLDGREHYLPPEVRELLEDMADR